MNVRTSQTLSLLLLSLGLAGGVASCSGGQSSSSTTGSGAVMDIVEISHGFGLLVPHQIFRLDAQGNPTPEVVSITELSDLASNVAPSNPVFAPTAWPNQSILPNGQSGNHFIFARFSHDLEIESVLDGSPAGQTNSGLLGTVVVLALDPATGNSIPVKGRAFVGGRTFAGTAAGDPPLLEEQRWVRADGDGNIIADEISGANPGLGFPGSQGLSFAGAADLVSDRTFCFVVDSDGDLTTHETFPANRQILMRVSTAVRNTNNAFLSRTGLGSATVGPDTLAPELATTPPPNSQPLVAPGAGDTDVDPNTDIRVTFTEPIQPLTLGGLDNGGPAGLSTYLSIAFGPAGQTTNVPFFIEPPSVFDLSVWDVKPEFQFPGQGPANQPCGVFNEVRINTTTGLLGDLVTVANPNVQAASTSFFTGQGPGLVNAPVLPDVIYATRLGAIPSLSVLDLNGFGAGTGNPTYDFSGNSFPAGNSNYPNNLNVQVQGAQLFPQLQPGSCTFDGGSEGVFTLSRDSNLDSRLLRPPVVTQVGEVMAGWSLDVTFNNGLEPQGCQAGGGNLCAITGLKRINVVQNTAASVVPGSQQQGQIVALIDGGPNPISFAPHPNPPPLIFPPLCVSPFIGGQEPTSIDSATGANGLVPLNNLLVPGNPFGVPDAGIPPGGLLAELQNAFFEGPSIPGVPLSSCQQYQYRQQVGHYLYMADRARREVVVLNSNRMTVLDRIPVSDPTEMAMGPNLDFLAVSNSSSDTVSFIDINPGSSTFHTVVQETQVGRSPRGIAWDPGNEDILVTNEQDNTMSVISALNLQVRNTVSNTLVQPFDVIITQRQDTFGFLRLVYYGWVLNRSGRVSIFESGPSGPNGWGFDDIVGTVPFIFDNPRRLAVDTITLNGSIWVVHENPLSLDGSPNGQSGGAITNLFIQSANFGPQLLNLQIFASILSLRDLGFAIRASIGQERLTGIPVDLAFDNLVNVGSVSNKLTVFSAGFPLPLNGKSGVRTIGGGDVGAGQPRFMFAAVPNSTEGPGVIDVISLDSGNPRVDTNIRIPGIQSIPVPGVSLLSDYFRP